MSKKMIVIAFLQIVTIVVLAGCGSSNKSTDHTSFTIADFYGDYIFDEVAYMRKPSTISEEQYQKDLKAVTETFTNAEFSIKENYFHETSGTFGDDLTEDFEFMTIKDYGETYYNELASENLKNFEGLSSIFDYDEIKKELGAKEIKHYMMYVEDGIMSNPTFYITKDHIYIAMETISLDEAEDALKGYTHYLLKLKDS